MTTARLLTPPGRGAIAVVVVEGPDAARLVDAWFAPQGPRRVGDGPLDSIRFGRWRASDEGLPGDAAAGEEVVAVRTHDRRVEVHCHGGAAASAAIVAALVASGATLGEEPAPSRFTEDALLLLRDAPTERAAGVLLDQAAGALDAAVDRLHATIERGDIADSLRQIDGLLATERLGRRLVEPWSVVLAGEPNVGKSSLINALVGYTRAIVYDRPGTTRDVVTASTAIRGWPVTLADTAGIRATADPLESAGAAMARRALAGADVVMVVGEAADWTDPAATARRAAIAAEADPAARRLEVANKTDLAPRTETPAGVVRTSATSREGIEGLLAAIGEAIEPASAPDGAAVVFRPWHAEQLRHAREALAQQDARLALSRLTALHSPGSVCSD